VIFVDPSISIKPKFLGENSKISLPATRAISLPNHDEAYCDTRVWHYQKSSHGAGLSCLVANHCNLIANNCNLAEKFQSNTRSLICEIAVHQNKYFYTQSYNFAGRFFISARHQIPSATLKALNICVVIGREISATKFLWSCHINFCAARHLNSSNHGMFGTKRDVCRFHYGQFFGVNRNRFPGAILEVSGYIVVLRVMTYGTIAFSLRPSKFGSYLHCESALRVSHMWLWNIFHSLPNPVLPCS
jgi:hypothetical protein